MTGNFGLRQEEINSLRHILSPLAVRFQLAVFGSRAKGTWRRWSDIDILVSGPEPVPLPLLAAVGTDLAESALPVRVDLVDAGRANSDFIAQITPDLVTLDWLFQDFT